VCEIRETPSAPLTAHLIRPTHRSLVSITGLLPANNPSPYEGLSLPVPASTTLVSLISHTSYPLAYKDGTNRVFRNIGYQTPHAGEQPKRLHATFRTQGKLEIKKVNEVKQGQRMFGRK
jgi:hypothetical protein